MSIFNSERAKKEEKEHLFFKTCERCKRTFTTFYDEEIHCSFCKDIVKANRYQRTYFEDEKKYSGLISEE